MDFGPRGMGVQAETSEGKGTTPRLSDGPKDRQMDLHASRSPKAREDQTHQTRKSKGLATREREGEWRTAHAKEERRAGSARLSPETCH